MGHAHECARPVDEWERLAHHFGNALELIGHRFAADLDIERVSHINVGWRHSDVPCRRYYAISSVPAREGKGDGVAELIAPVVEEHFCRDLRKFIGVERLVAYWVQWATLVETEQGVLVFSRVEKAERGVELVVLVHTVLD